MAIYFRFPFGVSGDRTAVPYTAGDGSVNYEDGYGSDYSLPRLVNPSARDVERIKLNQILFDITSNLQQYQQHGIPEFITTSDNGGTPFSYDQYAVVRYNNGTNIANYVSKVGSNTTLPTNATNWALIGLDPIYSGTANTFTAQQTINANGSPLVVQSTDSTSLKIIQKNGASNIGGIGASASYSTSFYLADLTTVAGGFTTAGHFASGTASTYDLGVSGTQWRNVFADRYTVTGNTLPTNGIYLPSANTLGFTANGTLVGTFTSTGLNATVIGASTPAAGTFTTLNATTYASGAWNGSVVAGQYGGTGVANTGRTITLAGNLTHSGAFTQTFVATANTTVTLPTTGTLATLAGTETLSNKTLTAPVMTAPTLGVASATSINFGQDPLNYYDEGTFTPTWTGLTVVGTPTYTGVYTRIGRMVFCSVLIISTTSTASTAGSTSISGGLPFAIGGEYTCAAVNAVTRASYGIGFVRSSGNAVDTPTWPAVPQVVLSFSYQV